MGKAVDAGAAGPVGDGIDQAQQLDRKLRILFQRRLEVARFGVAGNLVEQLRQDGWPGRRCSRRASPPLHGGIPASSRNTSPAGRAEGIKAGANTGAGSRQGSWPAARRDRTRRKRAASRLRPCRLQAGNAAHDDPGPSTGCSMISGKSSGSLVFNGDDGAKQPAEASARSLPGWRRSSASGRVAEGTGFGNRRIEANVVCLGANVGTVGNFEADADGQRARCQRRQVRSK